MLQRQGGFLIARIQQESGRLFARLLKEEGIQVQPQEGRILFLLWREGAVPIRDIARRTSLGKSTLTSLLDRMERAGHVRRVRSDTDRRVILIEAVARDEASQASCRRASHRMTDLFYAGMAEDRVERFEQDLLHILGNVINANP